MSIYTLSYTSKNLIEDLTADSLSSVASILEVARSRNAVYGITGALMFNEGRFTQILEGPEAEVSKIFKSIKEDARHSDINVIATQTVQNRRFKTWAMAFVGTSEPARRYYQSIIGAPEFEWKRVNNDKLCQLLLELVELDTA